MIIRLIIGAFRMYRQLRYLEHAEDADYWTSGNAGELENFFATETGRKLRARLRNYTVKSATDACRKGSKWESGRATGVADAMIAIEQHFPPLGAKSEKSEEADEHTALDDLDELTV